MTFVSGFRSQTRVTASAKAGENSRDTPSSTALSHPRRLKGCQITEARFAKAMPCPELPERTRPYVINSYKTPTFDLERRSRARPVCECGQSAGVCRPRALSASRVRGKYCNGNRGVPTAPFIDGVESLRLKLGALASSPEGIIRIRRDYERNEDLVDCRA